MDWALPTIAVVLLGYAAVSRRLEGTPVTAAMVFTGAGLLAGTKVTGLIDLEHSRETVKLLAEATLAVVLFADAARIDLRTLWRERGVPTRLLAIGLPLTIGAGSSSPSSCSARWNGPRPCSSRSFSHRRTPRWARPS